MSGRTEWRVVCADGTPAGQRSSLNSALRSVKSADKRHTLNCGPHRVQSRTVTTSEWADEDVKA